MSKRRVIGATVAIVLLTTACAKRVPSATGTPPTVPRLGWVIMRGDRDNPDAEFVCQSEPRTDCVLPQSRPGQETHTEVHFYFHSAVTDSTYTGRIEIGFLTAGGRPYEITPTVTVKKGDRARSTSVLGVVSSSAGPYPMIIRLVAEGDGMRREISDEVPVQVQPGQ
jgi:hypothetical protein